jgi:hypothetical protein
VSNLYDGRVAAWMAAWIRIQVIQDRHREPPPLTGCPESIDEHYAEIERFTQRTLAEAHVLVGLAHAPLDVGLAAGAWITDDLKRRDDEQEDITVVEHFPGPEDLDGMRATGATSDEVQHNAHE